MAKKNQFPPGDGPFHFRVKLEADTNSEAAAVRPPFDVPDGVVVLDVRHDASSTAARQGQTHWMAPEASEFDRRTGAWSDPDRYDRWLREQGYGRRDTDSNS